MVTVGKQFLSFMVISVVLMLCCVYHLTYAQAPPGGAVEPAPAGGAEEPAAPGGYEPAPTDATGVSLQNPLTANSILELFQAIIDILMIFAIPIIVFFIIYAGFLYVTARGNTETIQQAHRALLYALVGGLLIIGANVLIDVVGGTVHSITGP